MRYQGRTSLQGKKNRKQRSKFVLEKYEYQAKKYEEIKVTNFIQMKEPVDS